MQIENSPFQFKTVAVNGEPGRLHRVVGAPHGGFDDIDMAFFELLGRVSESNSKALLGQVTVDAPDETDAAEETKREESANKADDEAKPERHLRVVENTDPREAVQKELALLNHDLTAGDLAFLKEGVIPNLPILLGSVPLQTVFKIDPKSGGLDTGGFEISRKLAELIQKGYRTGRPFRVELDQHSSVVMKIQDGKVSADFISSDRAAAFFIKQELDELRARMAAKNLPVGDLNYRDEDSGGRHSRQDDDEDENL